MSTLPKKPIFKASGERGISFVVFTIASSAIIALGLLIAKVSYLYEKKAEADLLSLNLALMGIANSPHNFPNTPAGEYQSYDSMTAVAAALTGIPLISQSPGAYHDLDGSQFAFSAGVDPTTQRLTSSTTVQLATGSLGELTSTIFPVTPSSSVTVEGQPISVVLLFDNSSSWNFGALVEDWLNVFDLNHLENLSNHFLPPFSFETGTPDNIGNFEVQARRILASPVLAFGGQVVNGWSAPGYSPVAPAPSPTPGSEVPSDCVGEELCGVQTPGGQLALASGGSSDLRRLAALQNTLIFAAVAPFSPRMGVYDFAGRMPESVVNQVEHTLNLEAVPSIDLKNSPYQPPYDDPAKVDAQDQHFSVLGYWLPQWPNPVLGAIPSAVSDDYRYIPLLGAGRTADRKFSLYSKITAKDLTNPLNVVEYYDGVSSTNAESYAAYHSPALSKAAFAVARISGTPNSSIFVDSVPWTGENPGSPLSNPDFTAANCDRVGGGAGFTQPDGIPDYCPSVSDAAAQLTEICKPGYLSGLPRLGIKPVGSKFAYPRKVDWEASGFFLEPIFFPDRVSCSSYLGHLPNPLNPLSSPMPFASVTFRDSSPPDVETLLPFLIRDQLSRVGTRTDFALENARLHANSVATLDPGTRTVAIMLTDGLPDDVTLGVGTPVSTSTLLDNVEAELQEFNSESIGGSVITVLYNFSNKLKSYVTLIEKIINSLVPTDSDAAITAFAKLATKEYFKVTQEGPDGSGPLIDDDYDELVQKWKEVWARMKLKTDKITEEFICPPGPPTFNDNEWCGAFLTTGVVKQYNALYDEGSANIQYASTFKNIIKSSSNMLIEANLVNDPNDPELGGQSIGGMNVEILDQSLQAVIGSLLDQMHFRLVE